MRHYSVVLAIQNSDEVVLENVRVSAVSEKEAKKQATEIAKTWFPGDVVAGIVLKRGKSGWIETLDKWTERNLDF